MRFCIFSAFLLLVRLALQGAEGDAPGVQGVGDMFIQEYRVVGAHTLKPTEIQEAVDPFLGPGRSNEDVEKARVAVEKAYRDKGYQTVTVEVPPQRLRHGIIVLQVTEAAVGRLRVRNSRYFLPSDIKKHAPSLQEGRLPNFNDVSRDIVALNKLADRQVTPVIKPGVEPGTMDVDLNVKDTLPLHGSLELNNRYSPNTTPLRVNGSINYNNLWQLGHAAGFSFQVAPERLADAEVFSAYYSLPVTENMSFMVLGTKQDSDVSTLGGAAVVGKGQIIGARAVFTLPHQQPNFFHTLTFGWDYKHFDEDLTVASGATTSTTGSTGSSTSASTATSSAPNTTTATPIDYYPFSLNYSASWMGKEYQYYTELNSSLNFHARGLGSSALSFDNKRFDADGSYIYWKGDFSHTQDLPFGFQVFGKVQGQIADSPLINSEEVSGGGLSNVRGYPESTVLGDNGIFGTVELRSPSLLGSNTKKDKKDMDNEWRFYGFWDGGRITLNDPLPEQQSLFNLASVGVGSRFRLLNHLSGSVDVAWPLVTQGTITADSTLVTFRLWMDF
jgi:hemolysin activation/secretion protein